VGLLRRIWQRFTYVDDGVMDDCCRRGHIFTEANTYTRPDGRGRECRTCRRQRGLVRTINSPAHRGHETKEG
jgi:hypothetical protein